jgi:hypothetical protein
LFLFHWCDFISFDSFQFSFVSFSFYWKCENRVTIDKWHKFNFVEMIVLFRILECHEFLKEQKKEQ